MGVLTILPAPAPPGGPAALPGVVWTGFSATGGADLCCPGPEP